MKDFLKSKDWLWLFIVLLIYFCFAFYKLDARVVMDEPWLCSPGYNLITKGILAIPQFRGSSDGIDNIAIIPPLPLLMTAAVFKIFGLGIIQARTLSVLFGALVIMFTYLLAKELYDSRIALCAAALLAADNYFFLVARTLRGEILVAFFALLSVYLWYKAVEGKKNWLFLFSGMGIGLGVLSHQNAILGLFALVFLFFMQFGRKLVFKKEFFVFLGGFLLIILPHVIYVIYGVVHYGINCLLGQYETGERVMPVLHLHFINLVKQEFLRYRDFIAFPYRAHVFIAYLFGVLFAAMRKNRSDKLLLAVVSTFVLMFFVLVVNKNVRYIVNYLPFVVILTAGAIFGAFDKAPARPLLKQGILCLIIAFLLVSQICGAFMFFKQYGKLGYNAFMHTVNGLIPAQAVVYGPITFWLGLHEHEYYAYNRVFPQRALNEYGVNVFVLDDREMLITRSYLRAQLLDFAQKNGWQCVGEVDGEFYGKVKLFRKII